MNPKISSTPPLVLNIFKPSGVSSFSVVHFFKKNLAIKKIKIGHFGTLDPFAAGVLLIGLGKTLRLNEMIHDQLPKTYIAVGKLGVHTLSGDLTSPILEKDESDFLKLELSKLPKQFIEAIIKEKFLGEYWQAAPPISAAKFQGKALHQWAREGVIIQKDPKQKKIYSIEVLKYSFPYLTIRVKVSSGTYIRVLFQEIAKHFGTYGALCGLVRESVGPHHMKNACKKGGWQQLITNFKEKIPTTHILGPDEILPFSSLVIDSEEEKKIFHGQRFKKDGLVPNFYWAKNSEGAIKALLNLDQGELKSKIFFD